MSLRDPTKKMSKSDTDPRTRINITDSREDIQAHIRSAVTDGHSHVSYEPEARPGVSNLVQILAAALDVEVEEICAKYANMNMSNFKQNVADALINVLEPVRNEHARIAAESPQFIADLMRPGLLNARERAQNTMEKARALVGLPPLII